MRLSLMSLPLSGSTGWVITESSSGDMSENTNALQGTRNEETGSAFDAMEEIDTLLLCLITVD